MKAPPAPPTRECPFCAWASSLKAKKCPQCTTDLGPAPAGATA
jgi:hypothetical protein